MSMDENPVTEKQKQNKLIILLLILMSMGCAMFAWLYFIQKSEYESVTTENIQLTQESEIVKRDLQQLRKDYEQLKTTDSALQAEIREKTELIAKLQIEAEKHKNDAYLIAKLKKETKTLREIMQHFVREIDSLNTLNKKLAYEKDSVATQLASEKQKSFALQTEKDKLYKIGATLKAGNITVKAYNVRGKDRQGETNKAKKTDKIQVSFVLEENKIAPAGNRTIYIRMVTPDGKEWTESPDTDHMFTFGTSKGFYAAKKSIHYDNMDTETVINIKRKETEEFLPGKYLIEINVDNATIGSATLELE